MYKDIPGWEGLYSIDENGNVLSTVVTKYSRKEPHLLKPCKYGKYYGVTLHNPTSGDSFRFYIHRMVAMLFLPEPPSGYTEVNHIDGNKSNNAVHNLEWCTRVQNVRHAINTGLYDPHNKVIPNARLTLLKQGTEELIFKSGSAAAKYLGVAKQSVYGAINNNTKCKGYSVYLVEGGEPNEP